jgi:hypothetical protein
MSSTDGSTRSNGLSPDEARALYPDDITMREARRRYFERTGFDDATYTAPWMTLPVGPFTVPLPNLAPRKAAVRVHDLNHVLTGYGTDWHGEFSISAFELGMGVGGYGAAWMLNAGGVAAGLLRWPGDLMDAHARGRATRRSLYRVLPRWDEAFLDKTLGEVRALVGVQDAAPRQPGDTVALVVHGLGGALAHLGPVAVVLVALAATVRILW